MQMGASNPVLVNSKRHLQVYIVFTVKLSAAGSGA